MNGRVTVELKQLRFFAFHGLYPEEQKAGNDFDVTLFVSFDPLSGTITSIEDTINYARLYELVKTAMLETEALLETVAMKLAQRIHENFPGLRTIDISITKLHPPLSSFTGTVGTRFQKEYDPPA